MSRYSPTVQPYVGTTLTEQIAQAFDDAIALRDAKEERKANRAERGERLRFDKATAIDKGLRYGTPPATGPGRTITIPGSAAIPSFEDGFRRAVGAEPQGPPPSALDPRAFDAALQDELVRGGPPGSEMERDVPPPTNRELERGKPSVLGQPAQLGPVRHPGAFDPSTGQFGGAGGRTIQLRDPNADRYVPIDDQSYVDLEQTPAAETARNREAQLTMSSNLRGQNARDLEDQKQRGRQALSAQVARSNMVRDWHNAMYRDASSQAHDERGASAKATASSDSPAMTEKKYNAAADIVRATADADGKLDVYRAIEWLENTAEGQQMATAGMTRADLIVGFGRASGVDAKTGAALTQGVTGSRPSEAGGDVAKVRASGRATAVDVRSSDEKGKADWAKANPPLAGETREQYKARYEASKGKKPAAP